MRFDDVVLDLYATMVVYRLENIVKLIEYRNLLYNGSIRGSFIYSTNLEFNCIWFNTLACMYRSVLFNGKK